MPAGETRSDISGWTTDTLHAHIAAIINERDKRYTERFAAQEKATVMAADLAREAKAAANEWRGAMSDREKQFLPKNEFNAVLGEWSKWRDATVLIRENLVNRVTIMETRSITWSAAIVLLFTIIQFILSWMHKT